MDTGKIYVVLSNTTKKGGGEQENQTIKKNDATNIGNETLSNVIRILRQNLIVK